MNKHGENVPGPAFAREAEDRPGLILIIGGGPAGLAAAISAHDAGWRDILILERDERLGGILPQCIHDGFGLHRYKQGLTGPEYARRDIESVINRQIPYVLNAMVLGLTADRTVTWISPHDGLRQIRPGAVILAMGCRERTRGALGIPGTRCAGILTTGSAQRLCNLEGYLAGRRIVILGSGDIGLIMARRMTCEGAKVLACVEIMPFSSGLARNVVQCLHDYGIPLLLNHTVVDIHGAERLNGVTIARVDPADRKPIPGTEQRIECDTLLLSVGLIPENELSRLAGINLSAATQGPVVNQDLETSLDGVFACGNVLHVHDLVDEVSAEAERAGQAAVAWLRGIAAERQDQAEAEPLLAVLDGDPVNRRSADARGDAKDWIAVRDGTNVNGAVPQILNRPLSGRCHLSFRPTAVLRDASIRVEADGVEIWRQKRLIAAPGEMAVFDLPVERLPAECCELVIHLEGKPHRQADATPESKEVKHHSENAEACRELTCIGCPMSCRIQVRVSQGKVTSVEGFVCRRGKEYARDEIEQPRRTLTCLVAVPGSQRPLSVRTTGAIPKARIREALAVIRAAEVRMPVKPGDVILSDLLGSGVDVIATSALPED